MPLCSKVVPMTQEQRDRLEMPSICSQLPLHFANGFRLEGFEGSCSICNTPIKPVNLHGSIVRPFESVAIIEAIGICLPCKIAVPFFMRVKDDGTIESRDSKGNWFRSPAKKGGPVIDAWQKLTGLIVISLVIIYIVTVVPRQP